MNHLPVGVFTVIFPSALPFINEFAESLLPQLDPKSMALTVGLDRVDWAHVSEFFQSTAVEIKAIPAKRWEGVGEFRSRIWKQMVQDHERIVSVDSDDVLLPGRIECAVASLDKAPVSACALELIDQSSRRLGKQLTADPETNWSSYLASTNIVGLSNSGFRAEALAPALPVPAHIRIVDWYLSLRMIDLGFDIDFDPVPRMQYRQYGSNMARLLGPFDVPYLRRSTELVIGQLEATAALLETSELRSAVQERCERSRSFAALADHELAQAAEVFAFQSVNRELEWWSWTVSPEE